MVPWTKSGLLTMNTHTLFYNPFYSSWFILFGLRTPLRGTALAPYTTAGACSGYVYVYICVYVCIYFLFCIYLLLFILLLLILFILLILFLLIPIPYFMIIPFIPIIYINNTTYPISILNDNSCFVYFYYFYYFYFPIF
jgi:hypothetical protein